MLVLIRPQKNPKFRTPPSMNISKFCTRKSWILHCQSHSLKFCSGFNLQRRAKYDGASYKATHFPPEASANKSSFVVKKKLDNAVSFCLLVQLPVNIRMSGGGGIRWSRVQQGWQRTEVSERGGGAGSRRKRPEREDRQNQTDWIIQEQKLQHAQT